MLTQDQIRQSNNELWETLARIPVLSDVTHVKKFPDGKHNEVFRLFCKDHQGYVIQTKRKDGKKRSRSKINNSIIQAKAGIAPACIFYDDKVAVYEFVEGSQPKITDENVVRLAKTIKAIQRGPKMNGKCDPIKHLAAHRAKTKKLPDRVSRYLNQIVSKLDNEGALVPSHNDLALQNIIDDGEKMHIIDWEFSGQAVKELDPAMLSVHGRFTAKQDKLLLVSLYGNFDYDMWMTHKFYKLIFIGKIITIRIRAKNKKSLKAWLTRFDRILMGKY